MGKALERRKVGRPVEWGRYVRKESRSEIWGVGGVGLGESTTNAREL